MQTGREAINALFNKQKADHVPFYDLVWREAAEKWTTEGMPVDADGKPSTEHVGIELRTLGGWMTWHAKMGADEVIEETDETKLVRNGNGAVLRWWKNKSGTPEHVSFGMSDRQVWDDEYRPLLVDGDIERRIHPKGLARGVTGQREAGNWSCFSALFIWEYLRASLGDETMFMSLLTDPEWIHDFCRVYTDLYKESFKRVIAQTPKPDGIWIYEDLGYKERLFCSVDVLREMIFPYYKEVIDLFHSYDLPVILHSCGYQEPMIPLAIEAGFDGLNPMEVKAGNDIFKYAEKYADDLVFVGGFDARILESGDRALIEKQTRAFMRGMKERGARFIFGSDHSLSDRVNYQDFCLFLDVYREEREY